MSVTNQTILGPNARQAKGSLMTAGVVLAAILYPFTLVAFHQAIGSHGPISGPILAALCLAAAFAVPAICLWCAVRTASRPAMTVSEQRGLRLCYLGVAAPTAYTFMGVLWYMLGSPVADEWVWVAAWLALAAWALWPPGPARATRATPAKPLPALRVAHGITAALIVSYVVFHLTNHLFGLEGPDKHAAVMKLGRQIYRSPMVEPLLVALFLFQISSGVALAWRWSGRPATAFRVFQVASGVYLSVFILGHMNSVFVFARTFLKIQTDWAFAIGAPAGLLHDAWNIRLVPHYWLGVFFVLSHLASGVRVILTAHGMREVVVARVWGAGLVGSAVVASLILAGMCGLRLGEHVG